MKLLFALPGFHRFDRGAEVALLSVAKELALAGEQVTVVGAGALRPHEPYTYRSVPCVRRETFENWPTFPPLRSETAWEDFTFASNLILREKLSNFDATITCSFPFTHWALRRKGTSGPAHIFVTQNGDWPATSNKAEYRLFSCDGLVCSNPDFYERNRGKWTCALVPNGIDLERYSPGPASRMRYGIPCDRPVVLMVSALIESKRVLEGIRAVSKLDDAFLVVAGDGPLRHKADELAKQELPGRFLQISVPATEMPDLYRSADAFLHLSLLESFGNVFLEARATGLPIVAHDSSRLRWILGDDQYLCNTEDPHQLVSTLRSAVAAGKIVSRSGLERFGWHTIALQYRDFIADVLARR